MSLRDAILSSGQDLAVEVNQRALIDKVLARYSGEFTVYRELLQNANDAKATTVEIHFKSAHSANDLDLASNLVQTIIVRNDGQVFNEADWTRLRKIAEGNPDEEKVRSYNDRNMRNNLTMTPARPVWSRILLAVLPLFVSKS